MSNKIEELTPENKAAIPKYVEKWINIGFDNSRFDQAYAESIIHPFQKDILEMNTTPVYVFDSPQECWVACNYAVNGVPLEDIPSRVQNYFEVRLRRLGIGCEKDPTAVADIKVEPFVYPYQDGSFFAPIFSFYDYAFNELKVPIDAKLLETYYKWQATSNLGLIFPLENVCYVSQKPSIVRLNEEKRFHCDGDCCFAYSGISGFKFYALNGVMVSEYLATTPSSQLSLEYYHSIKNADERTEFVRKYGVERMLNMGKMIDSYKNYNEDWWNKSEYELWDMNVLFEGINYAPHLKMLNQTTGVWHVEAVSPNCRNLKDAIVERLGGNYEIKSIA